MDQVTANLPLCTKAVRTVLLVKGSEVHFQQQSK
jgi:hypothetical protein